MGKLLPYLLNLAGEYRICSELNKRGVFATMTYGNQKGADVYAINDRQQRAVKIEVKTSQRGRFVTSFFQKSLDKKRRDAPDFWVLFDVRPCQNGTFREHLFVLSHKEMRDAQAKRNRAYEVRYAELHPEKKWDSRKGVDTVEVKDVEQYEDKWSKIVARLSRPAKS